MNETNTDKTKGGDDEKLQQFSVHLSQEIAMWISREIERRGEAGLRASVSEIVRECIYAGHKTVTQDTDLLITLPAKLRGIVGRNKNRGLMA